MNPNRQLGLLWGGVATLMLLLSTFAERLAGALPPCPVQVAFGLPCLTCGATRAGLALARFDLIGAVGVNPLASLAWVGLVAGGLIAGVLALVGRPLSEPDWKLSLPSRWLLVAVLVANWVYLVGAGI